MNDLTQEILGKIVVYLAPSEVQRLLCLRKPTVHDWNYDLQLLWKDYILTTKSAREDLMLQIELELSRNLGPGREVSYARQAKVLEGIQKMNKIKIVRMDIRNERRMEGHAACLVLDRYIIVVEGWGPDRANFLHAYDGNALPNYKPVPLGTYRHVSIDTCIIYSVTSYYQLRII